MKTIAYSVFSLGLSIDWLTSFYAYDHGHVYFAYGLAAYAFLSSFIIKFAVQNTAERFGE